MVILPILNMINDWFFVCFKKQLFIYMKLLRCKSMRSKLLDKFVSPNSYSAYIFLSSEKSSSKTLHLEWRSIFARLADDLAGIIRSRIDTAVDSALRKDRESFEKSATLEVTVVPLECIGGLFDSPKQISMVGALKLSPFCPA